MAKDARSKKVQKTEKHIVSEAPAAVPKMFTKVQHAKPGKPTKPVVSEPEIDGESEDEGRNELDDDDEDEDEGEDGSEEDVDEAGMAKLMAALGEDGLDEYAQAELHALTGGEDDDEEDSGEGDDEEIIEGEKGEEMDENEEDDDEQGSEQEEDEEEDEAEGEGEDVALDDVDSVDADAVPRQKLEIDNKVALDRIRDTIKLDPSISWTETLTLTYPETIDVDVNDDLNRELAFYKQALHSASTAKTLAAKHNLPFTRPPDYFAEMVKSDAHMERIRQRLLDESATIKRSEEKRKEREGKKFGKQVQIERQKERDKSKKDMEERLKGLKRKRKGALDGGNEEDFDVAVEEAIADRPAKRARGGGPGGKRGLPRNARDKKFGFGGAGRRAKQNTKASTDDFIGNRSGSSARGGRGGRGGRGRGGAASTRGKPQRPGKSRRMKARS